MPQPRPQHWENTVSDPAGWAPGPCGGRAGPSSSPNLGPAPTRVTNLAKLGQGQRDPCKLRSASSQPRQRPRVRPGACALLPGPGAPGSRGEPAVHLGGCRRGGKGGPESVRDWFCKSEDGCAGRLRGVPTSSGGLRSWGEDGSAGEEVRRGGEAGLAGPGRGVTQSSGRDPFPPPGSEEGAPREGGERSAPPRPLPRSRPETLTVMAAPLGGGSRRQEGRRGSRARFCGADTPPPPPLSAAQPPLLQPFPSPALPRPLPSAHKTFFFFFSNFLGGPGRANGRLGRRDKQWRGRQPGQ